MGRLIAFGVGLWAGYQLAIDKARREVMAVAVPGGFYAGSRHLRAERIYRD